MVLPYIFNFYIMFVTPDPDEFFDAVFFIDPLTKTVDDSLVMALSKDPLNSDRYSKYLQERSSSSSPSVDDETNFALCLPRTVQSLSDRQSFNQSLLDFIKSNIPSPSVSPVSSDPVPDPTPAQPSTNS